MTVDVKITRALLLGSSLSLSLSMTACGEEPATTPPPNVPVGSPTALSTQPRPDLPPPQPVASVAPPVSPPKAPVRVMLSADDCKSAQKKLEAIKQEDMTTKDAKEVYILVKGAKCDNLPPTVTEAQKACLSFPQYTTNFVSCVTP